MKHKDYLERSPKRSPYDTYTYKPAGSGDHDDHRGGGIGYIIFMFLLLTILYPVGLCLLWAKRLEWSKGVKFLLTIVFAIIFCFVFIFAVNYDTGNERISKVQKNLRVELEVVDKFAEKNVRAMKSWFGAKYEIGKENALNLWDAIDEEVARKTLKAYSYVEADLTASTVTLPYMLLDKYKEMIHYEPKAKAEPANSKQTPDNTGIILNGTTPDSAQPADTASPVKATATPAPTPSATPAPSPTPTPEPIDLPDIKDASKAEVFFTPRGTYYHSKSNCSGMVNAVSHTLKEAEAAGKQYCDVCQVTPYSMMAAEEYLWIDEERKAHTTDECAQFSGSRYTIIPFDEVYNGSYKYCSDCKADVCYQYMLQNDRHYLVGGDLLDEERQALYDYERTITVYYGSNSRNYHRTTECMHMTEDKYIHTLYQALHVDNKQICPLCNPPAEEDALTELMQKP